MRYLLHFESYLKGGKQPLYHFILRGTFVLEEILESDVLRVGKNGRDINNKRPNDDGYLPSISVTRNKNYESRGTVRIELDQDLLNKDGYKSIPIDEMGNVIIKRGKGDKHKKYKKYLNPFTQYKRINHGVGKLNKIKNDEYKSPWPLEEEFEERIYKNIKNIGKYIISIRLSSYLNNENGKLLIPEYIKNYLEIYSHIKVLNMKEKIIIDGSEIKKKKNQSSSISL